MPTGTVAFVFGGTPLSAFGRDPFSLVCRFTISFLTILSLLFLLLSSYFLLEIKGLQQVAFTAGHAKITISHFLLHGFDGIFLTEFFRIDIPAILVSLVPICHIFIVAFFLTITTTKGRAFVQKTHSRPTQILRPAFDHNISIRVRFDKEGPSTFRF